MSDEVNMKALIKTALFTPTEKGWGLPLLFWGEPGASKTDQIEEVCADYDDLYCLTLSPAEQGEGAFGVTPVPITRKSGTTLISYPEPEWTLELEKRDGRGVIFIDEIPHAPPSVRPALLGLIQSRRIAGSKLGPLVRVLAAGNPPGEGAGGYALLSSAANRMGHIKWARPTNQQWSSWLLSLPAVPQAGEKRAGGTQSAATEEKRVMGVWPNAFGRSRALFSAFLNANPGLLHKMPRADSPALSLAWPSHRTWYLATLAHAGSSAHRLDAVSRETLVASFVGDAAAAEFTEYAEKLDLPNPSDVLDGTAKFKHDELRLDITRVVFESCASLVADPSCGARQARMKAFWDMLLDVMDDGIVDLVVTPAKTVSMSSKFPDGTAPSKISPSATKVLAKLRPALGAGGLLL